jgi:hypothetical protein
MNGAGMLEFLTKAWTGLLALTPGQGMELFGIAMFFLTALFIARAHYSRKSKIDLQYVLVDTQLKQVTQAKFLGFIGGMAATWLMIYLPVSGKFSEAYALGYLGILVAGKVASDYINNKPPGG